MSDIFDQAQEIEQLGRAADIFLVQKSMAHDGTNECVDCGCSIEPSRKKAMPSATRCIDCQSDFERQKKCGGNNGIHKTSPFYNINAIIHDCGGNILARFKMAR